MHVDGRAVLVAELHNSMIYDLRGRYYYYISGVTFVPERRGVIPNVLSDPAHEPRVQQQYDDELYLSFHGDRAFFFTEDVALTLYLRDDDDERDVVGHSFTGW